MSYIKTIKGLGIYLICLGALLALFSFGEPDADSAGAALLSIILICGPGIWLTSIANRMKDELPGFIRKCPYCAEDIHKDAIVCKHCKKDLSVRK